MPPRRGRRAGRPLILHRRVACLVGIESGLFLALIWPRLGPSWSDSSGSLDWSDQILAKDTPEWCL